MNFLNIFPTVIGYVEDSAITEKILPIAKKQYLNTSKVTNAWGYKNTYGNSDNFTDANLDFIRKYINELSILYLNSNNKLCPELKIEIFFSEMGIEDSHGIHCHANSILSGIFYLNVPDNSAPIIFHDSRPHLDFISFTDKTDVNMTQYTVTPKTGLILIWPAWVRHEVPKNTIPNRVTAVFNVIIKS